ncbi:MAG TPA: S53 family peptidase [Steroidobacteraceae bacterium]|nr:S53 family peptidase [Steroidobacteraceae bacterium]
MMTRESHRLRTGDGFRRERTAAGLAPLAIATAAAALVSMSALANSSHAAPAAGYTIAQNTPGFIKRAQDLGPLDPTQTIAVTVWLKLRNTTQLDRLAQQQRTKGSADYHRWIDQATFDGTYAPAAQEVKSFENFASAHSLTVLYAATDNAYVKVSATVAAIEQAFHTQIDSFSLNRRTYYANTADPSVNDASGAHVDAISGLDDFGFTPDLAYPTATESGAAQPIAASSSPNGLFFESQCFTGVQTQTFTSTSPVTTATYSGNRYGADIANNLYGHLPPCGYQPSELQTAYGMNSLYAAGYDGSGQTVVITDAFGSPTIESDANVFSALYGLPPLNAGNFQVVSAPGTLNFPGNKYFGSPSGWADEITLDVEWVHAMAPGAKIVLVVGPNNGSDLDEAVNFAVVHHYGNTISNSWSGVEGFGNPAQYRRDNRILEEAAVQGIDVNFSSGDSGDFAAAVGFKTVGFPGSSPYATAVGGTSLALNPDDSIAFQTGWGTNLTRLADRTSLGSPPDNPPLSLGFQFGAGGGTSLSFAKPGFQASLPGTMRNVPDVSMVADPYTGVEIIETVGGNLSVGVIGGTSLACPTFSAIMAIAAQKAGHPLGQAAPLMYGLASTTDSAHPIYDVTAYSSPTNVSGTITVASGTSSYSADQLASPLDGTTSYYSAFYNSPFSTRWFVLTFGTDSSLTTGPGWDDVTGVGTPNGANFVDAVSGL